MGLKFSPAAGDMNGGGRIVGACVVEIQPVPTARFYSLKALTSLS